MFDTLFTLLQAVVLPALLAFVGGVMVYRYNLRGGTKADDCRKLRDLVEELRVIHLKTQNAVHFEFRELPRRRWDDAPQDRLRREDEWLYHGIQAIYERLDKVNEGSEEVQRRRQQQRPDMDQAKADVRDGVEELAGLSKAARTAVRTYVDARCR